MGRGGHSWTCGGFSRCAADPWRTGRTQAFLFPAPGGRLCLASATPPHKLLFSRAPKPSLPRVCFPSRVSLLRSRRWILHSPRDPSAQNSVGTEQMLSKR